LYLKMNIGVLNMAIFAVLDVDAIMQTQQQTQTI